MSEREKREGGEEAECGASTAEGPGQKVRKVSAMRCDAMRCDAKGDCGLSQNGSRARKNHGISPR